MDNEQCRYNFLIAEMIVLSQNDEKQFFIIFRRERFSILHFIITFPVHKTTFFFIEALEKI